MQPLIDLVKVYDVPLNPVDHVITEFAEDNSAVVLEAKDSIDKVITKHRKDLGLEKISPMLLTQQQASDLRERMTSDARWKASFLHLISAFMPGYSSDAVYLIDHIKLPWWNMDLLLADSDKYNSSTRSLILRTARVSHSYITQIARTLTDISLNPLSVTNVLTTADGYTVLGWRAGKNLPGTMMTVPAGSVRYQSGVNPLFETLCSEHRYELGLDTGDIEHAELIGKLEGGIVKNQPHYVFHSATGLSFTQLAKKWRTARDKAEHSFLVPLSDSPDELLETLAHNRYEPTSGRDAFTAPEKNIGQILPQAVASLLVYYTHMKGLDSIPHAQSELTDLYPIQLVR